MQMCKDQSVLIGKMRDDGNVDKGGGWQCHWKNVGGNLKEVK